MIAIFAKNPFFKNKSTGTYLSRVSSRVRGEEIAEYLGAILNPPDRIDGAVCIFLKPRNITGLKDGDYVDILDEPALFPKLKERPGLKVISMSQVQHEYLKKNIDNELHLIHHHHINFERDRRKRGDGLIGGAIGHSEEAYSFYKEIEANLAKAGIEFKPIFSYTTREDMTNYFKSIDFLVAWNIDKYKDYPFSHPTKIINAASFGVPTLTQPIAGYKEFIDYLIPITDMDSLVVEAEKLKDHSYWDQWSDKVYNEAEKYHISNIAKLYQQLT